MTYFTLPFFSRGTAAIFALLATPVLLAQLVARPALAADYDVGTMHISQPWARATPKGAAAGAGYMTITNKGTASDRVSCVSDDASAQCQIHSMTMDGGVMKMRPVEGGLEIKPGETVTAKLKFDHAGTVDVEYAIAAIGAPAPGAAAGGGSMQGPGGGMNMQGPNGGMQMNKP
jgi:copper(I)-binding protein